MRKRLAGALIIFITMEFDSVKPNMRKNILIAVFLVVCAAAFAGAPRQGQSVILQTDTLSSPVQIIRLAISDGRQSSFLKSPIIEFASPQGRKTLDLTSIQSIYYTPERRIRIVSDAEETRLIPERRVPMNMSSPSWFDADYDDANWERPIYAHPNYQWFYIPGAAWIWAKHNTFRNTAETLLVRRKFNLPENEKARSAILTITADDSIQKAYINGMALPIKPASLIHSYIALDVANLLQKGENVISLKAASKPEKGLSFAGLAFRIDVYLVPAASGEDGNAQMAPALLVLDNNDRILGRLISLSDRWVELESNGMGLKIDRDWVRMIHLNYTVPEKSERSRKNILGKITGLGAETVSSVASPTPYAIPIYPDDPENRMGILLRTGEFIGGRIMGMDKRGIIVKPRYGHDFQMELSQIGVIYPNAPSSRTFEKYPDEDNLRRCEAFLLDGSRIAGILFDLSPDALTVLPSYTQPVRIKNSLISHCNFPYRAISDLLVQQSLNGNKFPVSIALIGDSDARIPYDHSTYYKIQSVLSDLKIEGRLLSPEEMVDAELFTPKSFPLVLNIDETETYYKTVKTPQDGFRALTDYVKQGGCLAHLATGYPAFYGYESLENRWRRTSAVPWLNKELGMHILKPGERYNDAYSFELPDNKAEDLFFDLNNNSPYAKGLPERVDFPLNTDVRFRPIVPDNATTGTLFTPVYWLKTSKGKSLGAAMAIIDYSSDNQKRPRSIYVSHLIFTSEYKGRSMLNYLIPKILSLSIPLE